MNRELLIALIAVGLVLAATVCASDDPVVEIYLIEFQIVLTVEQEIEIQSSAINSDGTVTSATEVSKLRIGDMMLDFDSDLLWEGRPVPSEESGVKMLAAPTLLVPAGEKATMRSGSSTQVQYLERQEGDYYKVQSLPSDFSPGVFIEVVPRIAQPDDQPETVYLDLNLRVTVLGKRELLPGVNLDVGRPGLHTQELNSHHRYQLNRWNLVTTQLSRDLAYPIQETILVLLRVSRVNRK